MHRALLVLLAAAAAAQDKQRPIAFDAALVKAAELPRDVKLVDGMHCVSPQARTYFETPAMKDIMKKLAPDKAEQLSERLLRQFPVPTRKECQSFQAAGRPAGSVLVYEYAGDDVETERLFLRAYIWGDRRSEQHPEEIIVQGPFIWVLSFPYPRGDPAAEWHKTRLRKKFRVPAFRDRPELAALEEKIAKAFGANDAAAGIRLMQENAKAVAFAQNMLGQFAELKSDHALAEKAYRKALKLHDALADPLDPDFLWAALDGLGRALGGQGRYEEAARAFERAIAAGNRLKDPSGATNSCYGIARVLAAMQQWGESLRALRQCISIDKEFKRIAQRDPAFADARERPEFQELLK